jgi:hypothetical protein
MSVDDPSNYGSVYVFNCYNEGISHFSVAGTDVGTIGGWSKGSSGQPAKYTPASLAVPRSKHQGDTPGTFAIGPNPIQPTWDSFFGTGDVTIPDASVISLDDDLVLFICLDTAVLLDTRGHKQGEWPIKIQTAKQ